MKGEPSDSVKNAPSDIMSTLILSGCMMTSPLDGDVYDNTTSSVYFRTWTTTTTGTVDFHCSPAAHYGVDSNLNQPEWRLIRSIAIESIPHLDSNGEAMYSANLIANIPDECWRRNATVYNTVVRASQIIDGRTQYFSMVDEEGLGCLIETSTGSGADWFGWVGEDCITTSSGNSKGWALLEARRK